MSGLFVVWKLLRALASVTLGSQFRLFESLSVCISGRIFAPFRSMKLGASCTVSYQIPQCRQSRVCLARVGKGQQHLRDQNLSADQIQKWIATVRRQGTYTTWPVRQRHDLSPAVWPTCRAAFFGVSQTAN